MLTFRKGLSQGPAAARRMADHLAQRTLPVDVARRQVVLAGVPFAAPDGTTLAVLRADLDPVIARRLGTEARGGLGSEAMTRILMGRRADGLPFESIKGNRKVAFIDMCLSAEKGVSLLWAFSGDAAKSTIAACQRDAVTRTMAVVEAVIARSRRGKGGRDGSEPGTMSWFTYEQYTARKVLLPSADGTTEQASDPQCHTHVIVPNVVWTQSGRVTALDLQHMSGRVHEFGALFAAFLAENLREWGVETVLDRATGSPRLHSVPASIREEFSSRSSDGERKAREFIAQAGERFEELARIRRIGLIKSGVQKFYQGDRVDGLADLEAWEKRAARHDWVSNGIFGLGKRALRRDREQRLTAAADLAIALIEPDLQERTVIEAGRVRTAAARALIEVGIEASTDVEAVITHLATRPIRQDGSHRTLRAIDGVNARGFAVRRYTAELSIEEKVELETWLRSTGLASAIWRMSHAPSLDHRNMERQGVAPSALRHPPVHWRSVLREVSQRIPNSDSEPIHISIGGASLEAQLGEASIRTHHFATADTCLNDVATFDALSEGSIIFVERISDVSPRDLLRFLRSQSRKKYQIAVDGYHENVHVQHPTRDEGVRAANVASQGDNLAQMRAQNRVHFTEGDRADLIEAVAHLCFIEQNRTGNIPRVTAPNILFARQLAEVLQSERRQTSPETPCYALETIDLDGIPSDILCAVGDPLRLQSRVNAKRSDGRRGLFGVAGSKITILSIDSVGLHARNGGGDHGIISWDTIRDPTSSRLRLSQGLVDIAGQQGRNEAGSRIVVATDPSNENYPAALHNVSQQLTVNTLLVVPAQSVRHRLAKRCIEPSVIFTEEDIWNQFTLDMNGIQQTPGQAAFDMALATRQSAARALRSASLDSELRALVHSQRLPPRLRFGLQRAVRARDHRNLERSGIDSVGSMPAISA
ncbi:hypothetical protein D3273_26505 [Lichenibacterium minor]|uniref:TrwC relaxase domain-containing protein n=1 Tax=Lichenibacterium minor TaxID=2316528 RepID=A0A4Q2U297_9HYPH|nr:MobF family relaxase [Lichenibacterium minor]RYC28957.1 hypothetical protein D3273_26505 [Lichenibacterium minor]